MDLGIYFDFFVIFKIDTQIHTQKINFIFFLLQIKYFISDTLLKAWLFVKCFSWILMFKYRKTSKWAPIAITLIDEYYDRIRVRLGYLTWLGLS